MESFNDPLAAWLEPNDDAVASEFSALKSRGPLEAPERSLEQSEAAVPKSPLIFKKDKLRRPKIQLDTRYLKGGA